jgi:hypothetical protein
VNVPLPESAPGEWGPSKAVRLVGLLPLSHFLAVINAAPAANVSLREEKPLTLNMEFEMTRPLLDFIIRLHKTGDTPYDKVRRSQRLLLPRTCIVSVYIMLKDVCLLLWPCLSVSHNCVASIWYL